MKSGSKPRGNILLQAAGFLLILTVISTYFAGGLLAKYISHDETHQDARVAAFVLRVEKGTTGATSLRLDGITKPGDTATYPFKVTNHNGANQRAEVDEIYDLTVNANGNLPLTFRLTGTTTGANVTHTLNANSHDMREGTEDQNRTFKATVNADKEYTLTVEWPSTETNPIYASDAAVASCTLTVTGQQID